VAGETPDTPARSLSRTNLPNDLLTIFEEGEYEIPELFRLAAE